MTSPIFHSVEARIPRSSGIWSSLAVKVLSLWWKCYGRASVGGRTEVPSSWNLATPQSYGWGKKQAFVGLINALQLYNYPGITLINVLWRSWVALLRTVAGVEELSWATQESVWCMCCGRATLGNSGITLASALWKSYFELLRNQFGACAAEELLWATQGSLWPARCGRATLSYSGISLGSVLWKRYFELLRDLSGECAVEGLLWATQGSLWPVCCGRATLGYSGITLASVLWKSYFELLRD